MKKSPSCHAEPLRFTQGRLFAGCHSDPAEREKNPFQSALRVNFAKHLALVWFGKLSFCAPPGSLFWRGRCSESPVTETSSQPDLRRTKPGSPERQGSRRGQSSGYPTSSASHELQRHPSRQ